MAIGHVTQAGNISLPKAWREELGIELDSEVLIEKVEDKIVIEALRTTTLTEMFKGIDQEIQKKKVTFSLKEAVRDDLYE
ncbi:TPA: AbrB/MazE/SpoVT family DNA-binding domain-containing protein [Candidatus Woesearchaeota archaeon]|nr:AbrB/MazE/SpoVT family DNA-binding domain-containing protein [Candidatus Woesearchaeota archaeon]HIG93238.1 AbrB/MazE/SpoVT family DNA-binding domain-containing protein [Candidatus Woesearchaeota archaeon]HIH12838.1 AbrB/MazE/SpoVT family DNA-binding domain-containing protein [Candidatus Woesearchaeota archaeon]